MYYFVQPSEVKHVFISSYTGVSFYCCIKHDYELRTTKGTQHYVLILNAKLVA